VSKARLGESEAEETLDSSGDFRDTAAQIAVQGNWDGPSMTVECAVAASWQMFYFCAGDKAAKEAREKQEKEAQAHLLREVLGNLLRPVSFNPSWLTWNDGLIRHLAAAAYEHRQLPSGYLDPERFAVLADALEEAGCQDQEILGHLRGPGPHVRACWPVDLCLARS
jgi:hypothetical protein